jgi:hypothetical protein
MEDKDKTHFAPSQRASEEQLRAHVAKATSHPVIDGLMNVASGLLAVLNERRQVVAVNETFLRMLGLEDWEKDLGLRLGEVIGCVHAEKGPGGCGTSEFCATCGAAVAMVASLGMNKPAEETCAATVQRNGKNVDLYFRVRSFPITLDDTRLLLLFLQDCTQQQQWAAIERAFVHDVSNTVSALLPVSEMVAERYHDDNVAQHVRRLALRLAQETAAQRAMLRGGVDGYRPLFYDVSAGEVVDEIRAAFSNHALTAARSLALPATAPEVSFKTDLSLAVRILGNMITNALEATADGGEARLAIESADGFVTFSVWNRAAIAPDVARRVFQRNFSTKRGMGRGLGTWMMKVFGEQVLGGTVDFITSEDEGTTFRLRLKCRGTAVE